MPHLRSLPVISNLFAGPGCVPATLCRRYATDASVPAWPTCPNPTPYDIFNLPRKTAYNKARYFSLVKLYHPDRQHHDSLKIDAATRLDRYRLIVLAHEILSNPQKKKAYDQLGIGWALHEPRSINETYRDMDRRWHSAEGNGTARNASWEDWEAWREAQRNPNAKQEPIYMSNEAFGTLVVVVLVLAGGGHWLHMQGKAMDLVGERAQHQKKLISAMSQRGTDSMGLSREERLLTFIETAGYEVDWETGEMVAPGGKKKNPKDVDK